MPSGRSPAFLVVFLVCCSLCGLSGRPYDVMQLSATVMNQACHVPASDTCVMADSVVLSDCLTVAQSHCRLIFSSSVAAPSHHRTESMTLLQ